MDDAKRNFKLFINHVSFKCSAHIVNTNQASGNSFSAAKRPIVPDPHPKPAALVVHERLVVCCKRHVQFELLHLRFQWACGPLHS